MGGLFIMLLALVGVTGVGKTYYKTKIVEALNFNNIHTIRTRKARSDEISKSMGLFMSKDELDKLEQDGKIAYRFGAFGHEYAYLKNEIFSDKNMIFEMYYSTIYDWKSIRKDIKTIYILPKDIEIAKNMTKNRNSEFEAERLLEIDEQYNKFMNDKELRSQFDYIVYNNYDENSCCEILNLVKNIVNS